MRRQIVEDHNVASSERWGEDVLDLSMEGIAIHQPIEHPRRGHAGQALNIMVFQCPNGALSLQRSPTGAQPESRAILVLTPVSSRKTRLSGSINGWAALHSLRRAATSGRSCSTARSALLKRQADPLGRVPHCARAEVNAVLSLQPGLLKMAQFPGSTSGFLPKRDPKLRPLADMH